MSVLDNIPENDWQSLLEALDVNEEHGPLSPVSLKTIRSYEKRHRLTFPQSYIDFCTTFGPGTIGADDLFHIAVPGFRPTDWSWSLDRNQKIGRPQEVDEDSTDPKQFKRGIWFCFDINIWGHFMDTGEVTNPVTNEYAIYTLTRIDVYPTAKSFWDFIVKCCLSDERLNSGECSLSFFPAMRPQ